MVTPPKPPTGPAGPAKPAPSAGRAKPTQAPVTVALPDGTPVTGIVRTKKANLTERAVKTLGQAFVGTFATVFFGAQQLNVTALRAAALAAGSATLAALLSLVQNVIFGKAPE
jgi:hypothetical protein